MAKTLKSGSGINALCCHVHENKKIIHNIQGANKTFLFIQIIMIAENSLLELLPQVLHLVLHLIAGFVL